MMNGQHVNLAGANDAINDPIGAHDDLTNLWITKLGHSTPGVREVLQSVDRTEESPNGDGRVMRRVGFDERVDRRQVILGALGPVDGHARKRFLTSS